MVNSRVHRLVFCMAFTAFLFISPLVQGATLTGTYTLPGSVNGNTVNNLTDLSTLLNNGSNTVSGTVIFEFTASYNSSNTETLPVTFNTYSGAGNVVIRPAASVSSPLITGGSPGSAALIQLNGVKNLTFDGRPGGTGTTIEWTIQNTAAGGSYPTFLFINGASYDTLNYLTVLGSGTSSTSIINLSTSTAVGGNSYDVISNCNIGNYAGYPYNPILSVGSTGNYVNSNNSILNNNIYNFATYNNNSPYYAGINIGPTGNGSNWTISGNSIYSSINYLALGSTPYHAIYLNAGSASTGNVISGNYIGGQQALCGGNAWQVPAYGANGYADFDGIAVAAGACSVTNNVIKNIFMASRYGSSTFRGISIISGTATVSGNTIGAANDSIISGLYGTMIGIHNQSTSAVTINNNIIADFVSDGRAYNSQYSGTTTGVSIGIYVYSGSAVVGATTITNNSVYNFSRIDNYNNNLYFPVDAGGGSSVSGQNIIYEMNTIAGISVETAGAGLQTISKNTIYNLYNNLTGGTFKTYINGIVDIAGSGGSNINGNLVYGLYAPNTYGASGYFYGLNGIYVGTSTSTGTHTITNNMVDLGLRPTDGSSVQNALISGIWDNTDYNGTTLKVKLYHNSVYVGGSNTNQFANNLNSYAFRRVLIYGSTVYDSLALYNNIFVNNRSNTGGTAVNYAMYLNSNIDVASNYNDLYGTGTGFVLGDMGGTDYATLAAYRTGAGLEGNSISADPLFTSAATATPNLHVQAGTPIDQAGTATATLVYDFDSLVRANYSPVDIGAAVACSSASSASVTLSVSQDTVCSGTSVTFTATGTNGGNAGTYNFYKNGISVQNGASNTYVISSPANNDSVKVVLTSSAACVSPATAASNSITIAVSNNTLTPSVSIGASGNNICHGTSVTFTATPGNGGTAPTYNFYVNGNPVQNGAGNTYTSSSLNNGDSVWVVITSNAACLSTTTATSSKVYMVVTANVVPTATISATQTTICQGTQVTFTAGGTNGGAAPVYNFYKNNNSVQSGAGNTYAVNNLSNGDSVWVVVTSNAACVLPANATSTKLHITVNATVVPAISITTTATTICSNTQATFMPTISNGGSLPVYQWRLNGNNVATGASYGNSALANGDVVSCVLTSNAACALPDTAVSNAITMTVTGLVTPTISIGASPALAVCAGTGVQFTATTSGGGNAPSFAWKKNGIAAGTNSANYTDAAPANNDIITCVLTSNAGCASPATANSNADTIKVYQAVTTPQSQSICQGDSVIFYGTVLKQSNTYTHILTGVHGCDSTISLTLVVNPVVTTTRAASVCYGGSYAFNGRQLNHSGTYNDTVSAVSGCDSIISLTLTVAPVITSQRSAFVCSGSSYNFNGRQLNATGNYSDTLTTAGGCDSIDMLSLTLVSAVTTQQAANLCSGSAYDFNGRSLTTGGTYTDTLTAAGGCDSIVTLTLTVVQKPVPVVTLQGTDSLSTTVFASYQWLRNGQVIAGATSSTYIALQNGAYTVAVVDPNGCNDTSAAANVVQVSVEQIANNALVQLFPNPASGSLHVAVSGLSGSQVAIRIYDAYGNLVYNAAQEVVNGASLGAIDVSRLASGVYLVQLISDELHISRRVEVVR